MAMCNKFRTAKQQNNNGKESSNAHQLLIYYDNVWTFSIGLVDYIIKYYSVFYYKFTHRNESIRFTNEKQNKNSE